MKLELTSDRTVTVDGLGVLNEGEPRLFSEEEVAAYFQMLGVPPDVANLNLPEGVDATLVAGGDE